ncbi:unnamed protein product [Adineta steineri]|uniref:G-protein coupled receptors family 1 profile domain-containing protein n=1 Tax=Adineta steineri TaxID=433720 RepID=A0A815MTP8_9BILA|nr:unnamed protein product [Adineta steineri]CAF3826090.1 unnamed protein product [Adineta steineri]
MILLFTSIDTFRRLQHQHQQTTQNRRRTFLDRQMLIIMLTSIVLFLSTQIPLYIVNILNVLPGQSTQSPIQSPIVRSIAAFVASINYGVSSP